MRTPPWHFSRENLAKTYLKTLEVGPQSLAIFAERRKGKTEFLNYDLTPIARKQGFRCAYVNFWEDKSSPNHSVVNGINRSIQADAKRWETSISVDLGLLKAKMEQTPRTSPHCANEALDCLVRTKGPVLLMCDEVQHLATHSDFEDFTAALRTFIDRNKENVRVVFTGSSQDNLNRLFRNQRAAFYNSASITPFPDMGIEFVTFLSERFYELTRRRIPVDAIFKIFASHYFSPAFIVELLQVMVRDGFYDLDAGLDYYHSLNPQDTEHELTWSGLSALDKEVLKHLALPKPAPLYTPEAYAHFTENLGIAIGQGAVQAALKRLRERGVLNNAARGVWNFENKGFKHFVQQALSVEKS